MLITKIEKCGNRVTCHRKCLVTSHKWRKKKKKKECLMAQLYVSLVLRKNQNKNKSCNISFWFSLRDFQVCVFYHIHYSQFEFFFFLIKNISLEILHHNLWIYNFFFVYSFQVPVSKNKATTKKNWFSKTKI